MTTDLQHRAALHAALGDPKRLAVAESLVIGDRSPDWLCGRLQVASNLLAHHVAVLVKAGVVQRIHAEGDRRRRYLRLSPAGHAAVAPGVSPLPADRIVFVCTHNSARSQFAEALWRLREPRIPVQSAGTHPADTIHPMARSVAARHGVDLAERRPSALTADLLVDALVVTVCDSADQELLPTGVDHAHWSVPDPVAPGTAAAFEAAWDVIDHRVGVLAERVTSRSTVGQKGP